MTTDMGANPQAEDGHVDVANELADQFCKLDLFRPESKILWAILRKTYGWHKKTDRISITQFMSLTGLTNRQVCRACNTLALRNIINKHRDGYVTEYGIQKDYTKWVYQTTVTHDSVTDDSVTPTSGADGTKPLSPMTVPTVTHDSETTVTHDSDKRNKETTTKETIQKKDTPLVFGEFENIRMTETENDKLKERLGDTARQTWIQALSYWKKSKGKNTKSDYATILNWARRDEHGTYQRVAEATDGTKVGTSARYRSLVQH